MNIMLKSFAVSALALAIVGCSDPYQVQDIEQASDDDRQAYALGTSVGQYVKENLDMQEESEIMLDRDIVIAAFIDAVNDNSQMDEDTMGELLTELRTRVMEKRESAARSQGDAYLEENAERDGVQVTDSGLQYEVIREGDGEQPASTDYVQVHYQGTLVNGEVFDSSYDRGEPASFPLDRVISGWTEGLQLMSVGAHYRFVIPFDLAYGDSEVGGGAIPPYSTLIFEVELLEILDEAPDGM